MPTNNVNDPENNVDPSEKPASVDPSEQPASVDPSEEPSVVDPSEQPGGASLKADGPNE